MRQPVSAEILSPPAGLSDDLFEIVDRDEIYAFSAASRYRRSVKWPALIVSTDGGGGIRNCL